MFSKCESLTNIDLSNFNTQNVINMNSMFSNCQSLKNINLSNFKTQNVTNMSGMFNGCESLTNIDLSNFNTQNVPSLSGMFFECKSLINIDLSIFNTQNVINMDSMFYNCSSLKKENVKIKNSEKRIFDELENIYDDNINIQPFDLEENFDISSINLDDDYQYALKHNIQLEINRRKKANSRTTEVEKEYQILIDAAPQNIYNDLETKYSNLLDLLETKYDRMVAYNLATSNYSKAQDEYNHGSISKKEFLTSETNMNTALNNLVMVNYDFKIALETYRASAAGYGNS